MTFGKAFELVSSDRIKTKIAMRLPYWGADVFVRAQRPDAGSKMTAPYLYVTSRFGKVPWVATNIELFSEDWQVITAEE